MNHQFRNMLVMLLTLSLVLALLPPAATSQAQDTRRTDNREVVLDVVARLNAYRLERGLNPLVLNDTLMKMAQGQADYIASLEPMPEGGDMHIGATGEWPGQRAVEKHGWPTYGLASQVSIGENAGVGSVSFAMQYWEGSSIHRLTDFEPAASLMTLVVVVRRVSRGL